MIFLNQRILHIEFNLKTSKMKNPTVQKTVKIATIAGSAALVVGAGMQLLTVKSVREALMPAIAILVGVAAFNYAMKEKIEVSND